MSWPAMLTVALVVLPLAACGADAGTPGSSTAPPTPSPSRTETAIPSGSPPASPTCAPIGSTEGASSEDPLALSTLTGAAMRVGRHDCYERFTFEMTGTGDDPGWWAGYRDPMTGQASGEPVQMGGTADLEVIVGVWTVTDFEGRPDAWPPFSGPDDIVTDGFVALMEARNLYAYEGTTQIGLGVDRERPFRVTWLDSPPRLVVDIYTGEPLPTSRR